MLIDKSGLIEKRILYVLISLLVTANILYNTLTTQSFIRFRDVSDHPVYAINAKINEHDITGTDIVYLGDFDVEYYPNLALKEYYESKYGHIKWVWDPELYNRQDALVGEVLRLLSLGKTVYLGRSAAESLKSSSANLDKLTEEVYLVEKL